MLRSVRAMQCLLDAGALLEERGSKGGMTILHEAAKAGSVEMVELLLQQGADHLVNARDKVCGCMKNTVTADATILALRLDTFGI